MKGRENGRERGLAGSGQRGLSFQWLQVPVELEAWWGGRVRRSEPAGRGGTRVRCWQGSLQQAQFLVMTKSAVGPRERVAEAAWRTGSPEQSRSRDRGGRVLACHPWGH